VRINQPGLTGIWLAENTTPGSATGWLSTNASTFDTGISSLPGSLYSYTTSFNLTGLDPASAFINLCWSMDDWDTFGIKLNGITVPGSTANYQGFSGWTPISIPAGSSFTGGINTLEFIVGNGSGGTNPTGIMVDFKSYGAVPEPSTTAAVLGLEAVGLLMRRRRRVA
jgi:hypothetical protein